MVPIFNILDNFELIVEYNRSQTPSFSSFTESTTSEIVFP